VKDGAIQLVLDTSAVLAYAATSIHVGETIAEVSDEGSRFGVSVLCLAEATRLVDDDKAAGVELLVQHPHCVVLPVLAEDWQYLAQLTKMLGRADLAISLGEALDHSAHVLTGEPKRYRLPGHGELPIIAV
jgi:hypothetical protein